METQPLPRTPLIIAAIAIVALLVVSGLFVVYYIQTQNTIQTRNTSINSLNSQITSDVKQINQIQSNIASLQSQMASTLANINSLQTQAKINASQIATLNHQIASYNSQIALLNNQLTALQTQLNQLTTIESLGASTVELQDKLVQIPIGAGHVTAVQFTAAYAGYISVQASSGTGIFSSGLGGGHLGNLSLVSGIQVTESNGSRIGVASPSPIRTYFPNIVLPATGYFIVLNSTRPIAFPVIPGTIDVIFATSDTSVLETAILTVIYYY